MEEFLQQVQVMFDISRWEISAVDIGAIVGYFVLMVAIGFLCKDTSKNVSDYVRMGCKSTWWLMGLSLFISGVSASTFTGGGNQAYSAGWSIIVLGPVSGIAGWIFGAVFFAPWMRRTRAVTPGDAVRQRFGPTVEQIWVWLGVLMSFWGGVWLYSLATFISAAFNVPMPAVILFAGVVVVFYSVMGGSWSAQITDALQAMLIISIALVVAVLSLREIGWFDGLFDAISKAGLSGDYAVLKDADHQYTVDKPGVKQGYFTIPWLVITFVHSFILSANMTGCHRYLSTKSDGDARKSALTAAALVCLLAAVWYIPPMVGRLKYDDQIKALQAESKAGHEQTAGEMLVGRAEIKDAGDGAYAVVARNVLPKGLLGLVIVAMFAATMAAMDGNLTGTAGLVTQNLYPPLVRLFGGKPWDGTKLLALTKLVNLGFGAWAILIAMLLYYWGGNNNIYDIGNKISSLLGVPMSLPFAASFFVRRLPKWAPLVGMFTALINSAIIMFVPPNAGLLEANNLGWLADYGCWIDGLHWHWQLLFSISFSILPTVAMVAFWSTADEKYRKQVDEFFKQRDTPIDFKSEVGKDADHSLLKIVGGMGLLMAGSVALLVFFGEDWTERLAVLFIVGFMTAVSAPLYIIGLIKAKKRRAEDASEAAAAK
jgi:Na+/proline symporter